VNNLTIFVHLKPPISHGAAPSEKWDFPESLPDLGFRSEMLLEHRAKKSRCLASFRRSQGGPISVIIDWLDFADQPVASFRRSRSGSIAPIINTLSKKRVEDVESGLKLVLGLP
jgi:hypothetical protein